MGVGGRGGGGLEKTKMGGLGKGKSDLMMMMKENVYEAFLVFDEHKGGGGGSGQNFLLFLFFSPGVNLFIIFPLGHEVYD